MTNHDDIPRESVWTTTVSWGHLAIAIVTMLAGGAAFLMAAERRLTLLEERQAYVLRYVAQDINDAAALKKEVIGRLDQLVGDIYNLRVELARFQAVNGKDK